MSRRAFSATSEPSKCAYFADIAAVVCPSSFASSCKDIPFLTKVEANVSRRVSLSIVQVQSTEAVHLRGGVSIGRFFVALAPRAISVRSIISDRAGSIQSYFFLEPIASS